MVPKVGVDMHLVLCIELQIGYTCMLPETPFSVFLIICLFELKHVIL